VTQLAIKHYVAFSPCIALLHTLKVAELLDSHGAPGWDRTSNPCLRRAVLYPLSYGRSSADSSRGLSGEPMHACRCAPIMPLRSGRSSRSGVILPVHQPAPPEHPMSQAPKKPALRPLGPDQHPSANDGGVCGLARHSRGHHRLAAGLRRVAQPSNRRCRCHERSGHGRSHHAGGQSANQTGFSLDRSAHG
jgi:hypothetical protein